MRLHSDGCENERVEVDVPAAGKVILRVSMRPLGPGRAGDGDAPGRDAPQRHWYVEYGLVFSGVSGMLNVHPFGIGQRVGVGWRWIGLDLRYEFLPIAHDKTAEPGSWDSQVSIPVLIFGIGTRFEALPGWRASPYVLLNYVHVMAMNGTGDDFEAFGGQVGVRLRLHGPIGFLLEGGVTFPLEVDLDEDHTLAFPERQTNLLWHLSSGLNVRF